MGLIWSARLSRWRTTSAAEPQRGQNYVDDAVPIGAKQLRPDLHTASEIARNRHGRLMYGTEIPIEVYREEVVLPAAIASLAGVSKFPGWLFQMRGREAVLKRTGATVVLAKFPPSKNYVAIGELKRTIKDQKRGIDRHLMRELAAEDLRTDPADLRLAKAISRLSYAPFTNAFPAVAAWASPKESSSLIGAERRDGDDTYVVGLVPMPLPEAIETLKGDPILERSIQRTESGVLFANAKNNNGDANRGPIRKRMLQDVVERRHEILEFAIRVSLGGFVNPVRVEGLPVARWASILYYRFAYAAQSRIEDRKGSKLHYVPFPCGNKAVYHLADAPDAWSRKVETDERLYNVLAGPEGKAAAAVRALLNREQPEDLQDLLDAIRRIAGPRPTASWVTELLREYRSTA